MGILILIVIFFWLIWPTVSRWIKRKAMERAEDYMRSSFGLPPREKKRKKSKQRVDESENDDYGQHRTYRRRSGHGPIIPKEYAEDVEFTETIDYSEEEHRHSAGGEERYHESQISDAEFIEIKKDSSK